MNKLFLIVAFILGTIANVQAQAWVYLKQAGGMGDDGARDVALDGSGNAYVTGVFSATASFGSTTLYSAGYGDIFVAKISGNRK